MTHNVCHRGSFHYSVYKSLLNFHILLKFWVQNNPVCYKHESVGLLGYLLNCMYFLPCLQSNSIKKLFSFNYYTCKLEFKMLYRCSFNN